LKSIFAAAPVKVAIATLLAVVGEYEDAGKIYDDVGATYDDVGATYDDVGATYDDVVTTTGAGVLLLT
jgi:hypothetical protein